MFKLKDLISKAFWYIAFLVVALAGIFYAPAYLKKRSRKESIKNMNTDRVNANEKVQNAEQQWNEDGKEIDKARLDS